jgi:CubicO group peptidase (beta-lactamase class C family)
MQLVEAGKLSLDAPIGDTVAALANPQVVDRFDGDRPVLRAARKPLTLRHLLTHTSGFGYDFVHADMARARGPEGMPEPGKLAGIKVPLLFDPGERWEYGVGTDWVGQAVEAASGQRLDAYVADHIAGPLGMTDSGFAPTPERADRTAIMLARQDDGSLVPYPINIGGPADAEFVSGGGGMRGTATDYFRFLQMLLNDGTLGGVTILQAATVAEMRRNQIGGLRAGTMATTMPAFSLPVDWFPDQIPGWGLGFLINPETGPNGRAPGSLAWAGIANTYFWIDPAQRIAAILLMQLLPFADPGALGVLAAFEGAVYGI